MNFDKLCSRPYYGGLGVLGQFITFLGRTWKQKHRDVCQWRHCLNVCIQGSGMNCKGHEAAQERERTRLQLSYLPAAVGPCD